MQRLIIFFLLTSLLLGTSLVLLSKHWFPIWLGLELSTLSLIPLLNTNSQSRSTEATLKYFLVQAFSAALLLNGAVLNLWASNSWSLPEISSPLCYYTISTALIIKLGLAPCHFWFPDVLSGITFPNVVIIACWQKIAPMFLLLSLSSRIPSEAFILCSILSVLVGGWGGLNQISTRKILAYSSISHLGWITCVSFFLPETSIPLFLFYLLNNTAILLICNNSSLFSLSSLNKANIVPTNIVLFSIALLSLGGLPPLGGFINKIIPLVVFSFNSSNIIIPTFLAGSLLNLFFYLRIVYNTSLTLFPQNSIILLPLRSNGFLAMPSLLTSTLFPFCLFGLLLLPLFFLFI
uniref:NADH-ubiquinone oxidoreductase chain 2 n=1 Tax=Stichopus chloronotus TaxID=240144 RepID=A0A7U1G442_STICL|nr:NADH dehydrogenase subunit 2 [Stichopus chloronotus]QQY85609.1 NADH dehydrogenase subunit 2 [Stichopus chloronotus]USH58733.1 NADH dehydrogenase subunit 2 [Stichopus chloronotus]